MIASTEMLYDESNIASGANASLTEFSENPRAPHRENLTNFARGGGQLVQHIPRRVGDSQCFGVER